jgi:DNA-binding SARP family transcriptional activator
LAVATGRHLEDREQWERAAECYVAGLGVDRLVEALYTRLMLCHRRLGQRSEAVKVYHRCRHTLAVHLGVTPSAKTEALFATLRSPA